MTYRFILQFLKITFSLYVIRPFAWYSTPSVSTIITYRIETTALSKVAYYSTIIQSDSSQVLREIGRPTVFRWCRKVTCNLFKLFQ